MKPKPTDPPLLLFGPGGDYQRPWPAETADHARAVARLAHDLMTGEDPRCGSRAQALIAAANDLGVPTVLLNGVLNAARALLAAPRTATDEPMNETQDETTPRPWKVRDVAFGGAKDDGELCIWSSDGLVAYACTIHEGLVNAEANARLIVRAVNAHDDLLTALKSVLASVPFASYRGDGELDECERRVRAAIAKAEQR